MKTIVSNRAYAGPQDLQAMLALIKARPIDRVADFPGILDLQELLAVPQTQAHTRLWIDSDAQVACFAFLHRVGKTERSQDRFLPGLKPPFGRPSQPIPVLSSWRPVPAPTIPDTWRSWNSLVSNVRR